MRRSDAIPRARSDYWSRRASRRAGNSGMVHALEQVHRRRAKPYPPNKIARRSIEAAPSRAVAHPRICRRRRGCCPRPRCAGYRSSTKPAPPRRTRTSRKRPVLVDVQGLTQPPRDGPRVDEHDHGRRRVAPVEHRVEALDHRRECHPRSASSHASSRPPKPCRR